MIISKSGGTCQLCSASIFKILGRTILGVTGLLYADNQVESGSNIVLL